MSSPAGRPAVFFEYNKKFTKIRVDPSAGYETLLKLVAERWKISDPIELEYKDPASGDEIILSVDDDLEDVFSQNYKWKVLTGFSASSTLTTASFDDSGNSTPYPASIESSPPSVVDTGDDHDATVECKKEMWTELIPQDWECRSKVQKHPFFISYRQSFDSAVAELLFHKLKVAMLEDFRGGVLPPESRLNGQHPFLDAECLAYGQKWGVNFMSGLFHSTVIVLLCSDFCMERMRRAHQQPDNVLLEWELSLQMKDEKGRDVLPIFLSQSVLATLDDGRRSALIKEFGPFDYKLFPDELHKHPLSPGRQSVRETVRRILDLHGRKAHPSTDSSKIVTAAREIYSRRMAELQTPSPSPDISLSRSSLSELERWLTPLSAQMDVERQALLKNVLPDTRQWLLRKVFQFLSPDDVSASSPNRVMWLNGVAGVGKSVMAAMVSTQLQEQNMLGGLFFCKHDDERRNSARNLILTLAFGLASFSIHFGRILLQVKKERLDVVSRSVFEMMKTLIAEPLNKVAGDKKLEKPLVLIVDALDECGTINKRAEILFVFQELNKLLPVNVKILVTGRPELDIVDAFQKLPFEEIEPTAEENIQDQILYTQHFLQTMDADPALVEEGSRILVSKSSGVFVWLVTACKYLRNLKTEQITLSQIQGLPEGDDLDGSIDSMYDRIFAGLLETVSVQKLEYVLRTVLSIIVLAYEPLTAEAIVNLLSMEVPRNVRKCIRMLDPILVLDGSTKKIRIFHKSVKDYLTSPTRCFSPLRIDPKHDHSRIAGLCIEAMEASLKGNMCNLPLSAFHSEIPDFDEKVARGVPEAVKYSVRHFWLHCCDSAEEASGGALLVEPSLFSEVKAFMEVHGHHYLEASSLINCLHLVIPAMNNLQKMAVNIVGDEADVDKFYTLMKDITRVLQRFIVPLKLSALQVYFSAVSFSPDCSEFHNMFVGKVPRNIRCPRLVKGQAKTWPPCINVLEGHTYAVNSVAFSPDGQLIVSSSKDRTVRIWDAATGQEVQKLEGHTSTVNSAVFSRDGHFVVSGSRDRTVRIWNASTGQELQTLRGHTSYVLSVCFSPDGSLVVSGGRDHSLRIWDARSGEEMQTIEGHSHYVYSVSFSPNGQYIVSASHDKTIRVWDVLTGDELFQLKGHSDFVFSAAFSPDGKHIVSGSQDQSVRIWDAFSGQVLLKLEGHTQVVFSANFSPDGEHVVSGSGDNTLRIWDVSTGQELYKLEGHSSWVKSAVFRPDGQSIVTGSADTTIRIWTVSSSQETQTLEGHSDRIKFAVWSSDGRFVVTGGDDMTVRIWNPLTCQQMQKMEGHTSSVLSAEFSRDGRLIASASQDCTVRLWDAQSGQVVHKLEGHSSGVNSASFSPDGQLVVSASRDKEVRIWSVSTGLELLRLEGHAKSVNSAVFSPDGRFVVSGSDDRTIRLWSALAGQEVHRLEGHSNPVNSVSFSPDGSFVVSGSQDSTVRVWSVATGQELKKLEGYSNSIISTSAAPSPARWSIRSEDFTGFSKIWNLSPTGELIDIVGQSETDIRGINHSFVKIRNAGGEMLQLGIGIHSAALRRGVWFSDKVSDVTCWLPRELRGEWQLLSKQSICMLGIGFIGLIQL